MNELTQSQTKGLYENYQKQLRAVEMEFRETYSRIVALLSERGMYDESWDYVKKIKETQGGSL